MFDVAQCPSCHHDLRKRPKRKTKCPHCGQYIYSKRAPGETEKRLVTEAEAACIESLWLARGEYNKYAQLLATHGISVGEFDEMKNVLRGSFGNDHINWNAAWCLLNDKATQEKDLQARKMLFCSLARLAPERGIDREPYLAQVHAHELLQFQSKNKTGFIIGVEIPRPKPWPPAIKMLEMHAAGVEIKEIAKTTGYAVVTVERNIQTRGLDPRAGPQCEKHAGRLFSIDEALNEMPLPCGPNCVCSWRPLFRTDRVNI